ncbi:7917_t:CDS:2, partial [Gigaspora rosea]
NHSNFIDHTSKQDVKLFQDDKLFEKLNLFDIKYSNYDLISETSENFIKSDYNIEHNNEEISESSVLNDSNTEISKSSVLNNSDTEIDSVDFEDFYGASFENAVNEMIENHIPEWPNEIYQEFAKLYILYNLYYHPIIKTIKALLQKPNMTKHFVLQFEEKRKENMTKSELTFGS